MQFDTTYLTEAGRSLATGTLGGLDKIQFTRAVASSHDYSATPVSDLKKLTSIEDVQQTVEYSRIIKKDDTTLTMRVDFPSKDVTTAYSLYTVGFYARPENGDEILYGVLPSSLPDYIAAYDGKSNLNDSFQTDTTVSDADNVLITVSQAGSLNEADLDAIFASKHIATIDDIKANIPATVIDGSKPADFKEAVTLEKGAVDGAGNAIATTKNVSDGDAETLTSAKEYADTQVSGKADDSTVVHTADMRKLANQVASIDEVNAKQDKIGYTPADDSKVVHSTVTKLNSTDMNTVKTTGFYQLNSGTNGMPNVDKLAIYQVVNLGGWNGVQLAYGTNSTILGMRSWNGGNTFTNWIQFADDSKVVHLSGANNFDTVPTVNNNPLLLASSLPSDLARLSQDANFTAKLQQNGQDVALANNTIARNPDTSAVVDSVNFTGTAQKSGSSILAQSDWVKSDNDSDAKTASSNNLEGFYYTEG